MRRHLTSRLQGLTCSIPFSSYRDSGLMEQPRQSFRLEAKQYSQDFSPAVNSWQVQIHTEQARTLPASVASGLTSSLGPHLWITHLWGMRLLRSLPGIPQSSPASVCQRCLSPLLHGSEIPQLRNTGFQITPKHHAQLTSRLLSCSQPR